MIYYFYIIFMLLMGNLMFILSLYFIMNKMLLFLEFELIKMVSIKVEYLILMDWVSLMFISVVLMISSMVIFYSIEYMNFDLNMNRFMILVLLFVISMILMIISPNMISILVGWDGLGLTSYCLVIYYQNENSFNSGMVTVLTNRIGDILILILISLMISMGSWSIMFLNYMNKWLLMMLIIVAFTKSAQIPFSSWLPMAMAAPTPVSSLVHSSTLVTAGVYLLIRFNYLMEDKFMMNYIMLLSMLTLFLSGLSANFENDLKKIIALSTLSQLGIMIFCLSLNLPEISFFHLLTHAMFKSMLFMCAGVIIHNMMNNQDIRYISLILLNMPFVSLIFNCSSFSLCGIPFLSGFFSKDLILEMYMMNMNNKFMFLILFISMGLTIMYTFRLMYYSFIKFPKINIFSKYNSLLSLMSISMIFLYFMSIMMGVCLSWILFSFKNMIFLPLKFKLMINLFMLMGMIMGLIIPKMFFKKLFLINKLMIFFLSMWLIPLIYKMKINKILEFSKYLIYFIDLGWNEYQLGWNLIQYFKNMFFMDLFNKNFIYLLIFIMYMILIMMN